MQLKDSLRRIIDDAKQEMTKQSALTIINQHMGSPAKSTKKNCALSNPIKIGTSSPLMKPPIERKLDLIPQQKLPFLMHLYAQKFSVQNKSTKSIECFEQFAIRVYNKNRYGTHLNLSNLHIELNEYQPLNDALLECTRVNLQSVKRLNFVKLSNLFHESICELVLRNCGLNNQALNYLFRNLQGTNIVKLDLSSELIDNKNKLTDPTQLYNFVQNAPCLEILSLADVGLNSSNCKQIFQYLRQTNILSLDLSKNDDIVGVAKQLQILKLSNNKIKTLKGVSFKDCRFYLLDLSHNKLQAKQMESLFRTQVLHIKNLILDENPLGSVELLEKFLMDKAHIKGLSLKKCYLADDAIKSLMNGVEANTHIDRLDLSGNSMSKEGCKAISDSLRKIRLRVLNLAQCQILDEDGKVFAQQLIYNRKLIYLNLCQNRLSHLTGQALLLTLHLNISQNIIPYKYTREIQEWISYNNFKARESQIPINTTVTTQPLDSGDDEFTIEMLARRKAALQRDVSKLKVENSKLINNKQMYEELEEVYSFIDNQGSEKINNLMDELDALHGQINEQKEIKNEIGRKSQQP